MFSLEPCITHTPRQPGADTNMQHQSREVDFRLHLFQTRARIGFAYEREFARRSIANPDAII
jgi:hypothetical protein